VEVAQMLAAARHIDTDTALGRRLIAAWRAIDRDDPDPGAYARLVGTIEPAEIDYRAAFRSLLPGEDNHGG
jgi:hypothetical protein